jgi:ABC-2 type transport system permease protein
VFSLLIRVQPSPGDPSGLNVFAVWLMCALLPWGFFVAVVNGGVATLVGSENLIKKVYFPRWTLVLSSALAALNQWAVEMGLLLVVLLVLGAGVLPWLPGVVLAMVLLLVFALGVALALSIANVYFRDTQHLIGIVFQVWFYLTPILYPVSKVIEASTKIGPIIGSVTIYDVYQVNPMYAFSELFRNLLYDNRMPDGGTVLECVAWAVGSFAIGAWVFGRKQDRLAEVL